MKLNAPKKVTFFVALAFFVLALVVQFGKIAVLAIAMPWLWIVAFVLLALGVFLKDF
mgnify:CR=1 FL=1